ncbi:MAG: hypothetical protein ABJA57_02770 [Ginsengibacter sp.]
MYPGKKIQLLVPCLTFFICVHAQQFAGNPPSVKWNQVNTPTSRIIFGEGLDSTAKRVSNILSFLEMNTANTIGKSKKKINLVFQNHTTVSNAYVALGPYRSEFFLTHLQNSFELGSLPWPDQLAIHEFRHVQQYNNFNVGISKIFHVLFGQEGQALANDAAIPNWFFEGDAVFNETNVSNQGRGRLPFFFNPYRALWLAGKEYSWMKLRNGSYRDFTPDHYALGYLLVAFGREKYGDEFWKNVTHDAASFKGMFYPFQHAIKKFSGKSFVQFRNDALNYFKNYFIPEIEKTGFLLGHHPYISEEYPAFAEDNSLVLVKINYSHPPVFILRQGHSERKIRVKDVSLDNHFSYKNGKIVYASFQQDIRWGYRDYSNLNILNTQTGKQQMLTHRSKYFSPDINEAGTKVVAVHVSPLGESGLHVLDAKNGHIINTVPNEHHLFYTYPKFYKADKIISAVRDTAGQMAVAMISIIDGSVEYITPFSINVIGFLSEWHDTIYFSAAHKNDDLLFAYLVASKELFSIEAGSHVQGTGFYEACANNNYLVWTTFTANGYHLQQMMKSELNWKKILPEELLEKASDFGISAIHKTNANLLNQVPNHNYKVTKYPKATRLVNFHSIEPTADDPEYTLTLVSENILNTLQSQFSFTYNRIEEFKKIGFNSVYGALFPVLSAGLDYTIDRRGLYHGRRVFWNEMEPRVGISLPLNISKGRSLSFLTAGSNFIYNQSNFKGPYKDTLGNVSYSYTSNFFSFIHQVQSARQNIFPRFAQTISLVYKRALTNYEGSQFTANGNLYFPGLLKNHHLVINGAYLFRDTSGQINFSNDFPFSRGYTGESLHQMIKWGVNYHLPLFLPDAGFANLVYLLRVRGNVFYDFTHVSDFFSNASKFSAKFRSTGAELFFDTKWWNEAPLTFGLRYSYLLDDDIFGGIGRNRWELILPVNLLKQ